MDQKLTEEFYLAMNTLHWSRDEPNPYTDRYEHLLTMSKPPNIADRWYSFLSIDGPYDLVIEQCRFEVVRSLLQTIATYEYMAYHVIEAQELRDNRLKITLSKIHYTGD